MNLRLMLSESLSIKAFKTIALIELHSSDGFVPVVPKDSC
jgi:hypothetical protein